MNGDEERRQSSCVGKKSFDSAALAQRVATKRNGKYGNTHRRRQAYHCDYCGLWHVGTSKRVRR